MLLYALVNKELTEVKAINIIILGDQPVALIRLYKTWKIKKGGNENMTPDDSRNNLTSLFRVKLLVNRYRNLRPAVVICNLSNDVKLPKTLTIEPA